MSESTAPPIPSFREVVRRTPWGVVGVCGVLLGLVLVGRVLLDAIIPTADYAPRSAVTTWLGLLICLAAGFAGASRGRLFHQGVLAVFGTISLGFVVAIVGGPMSVVGMAMVSAIDYPRNIVEALDVPLPMMLVVGGVVGTVSAFVAALLNERRQAA